MLGGETSYEQSMADLDKVVATEAREDLASIQDEDVEQALAGLGKEPEPKNFFPGGLQLVPPPEELPPDEPTGRLHVIRRPEDDTEKAA